METFISSVLAVSDWKLTFIWLLNGLGVIVNCSNSRSNSFKLVDNSLFPLENHTPNWAPSAWLTKITALPAEVILLSAKGIVATTFESSVAVALKIISSSVLE